VDDLTDPIRHAQAACPRRSDDVTVRGRQRLREVVDRGYRCQNQPSNAVTNLVEQEVSSDQHPDGARSAAIEATVNDELRPAAQCPSSARRRRTTPRSCHVQVGAIDLVPLAGSAGDELEARQDAAIRQILLWLGQLHETGRRA
jgi:hypothetical protein